MRRAVKVSLAFATQEKKRQINALMEAYRAAVNFYIRSLWKDRGKLDKATLARLKHTRLSERYKYQALKQALEIVVATKKSAKELGVTATCPNFNGSAVLDAKFVSIEDGQGSFDRAIKLSTLNRGKRITLLTKKTAPFNKWNEWPGSRLVQGCALSEDSLILWFAIPETVKTEGSVLGIDSGIHKLISDFNGDHYGKEFKKVRDKIRRRKLCQSDRIAWRQQSNTRTRNHGGSRPAHLRQAEQDPSRRRSWSILRCV